MVVPSMGVPPNGLIIRENRTKMDDLGVPKFIEIPKLDFDLKRPGHAKKFDRRRLIGLIQIDESGPATFVDCLGCENCPICSAILHHYVEYELPKR